MWFRQSLNSCGDLAAQNFRKTATELYKYDFSAFHVSVTSD